MSQLESDDDLIVLGKVTGLYGVRGWVKVYSHTQPRDGILDYNPWLLKTAQGWQSVKRVGGRVHGKGIVVCFDGYQDRDLAATLLGAEIAVRPAQLPDLKDEVYWRDLVGLRVETTLGVDLGHVDHLFETGANDVVVVKGERERLIPWIPQQVVVDVDLAAGLIQVDWDPEF